MDYGLDLDAIPFTITVNHGGAVTDGENFYGFDAIITVETDTYENSDYNKYSVEIDWGTGDEDPPEEDLERLTKMVLDQLPDYETLITNLIEQTE